MRTYRLSLLLMLFSGGLIIQQSYGNVATTAIRKVSNNAAIVIRSGGIDSLFYIYTDHQGSILQLNNEAGAIVEQRVYDPWGRERTLGNWS
ncbi:MAG: hypothetical protein FWD66_10670, partial [Paludibacter sp.]|nr:hypothetical protein [Paludibacter sp.]